MQDKLQQMADLLGRNVAQVAEDLKVVRRIKDDPVWAINTFFKKGRGWFMDDLAPYQEKAVYEFFDENKADCNIWPRGHCKTTLLTRACCALEVATGISPYTVIFSSTEDNMRGNRLAFETIFTKPLFRDFQWYLAYWHGVNAPDTRATEILLGNGSLVEFKSFAAESRGLNREGRPYRIHMDDVLKTESATSFAVREEATDRYFSMIRPMGEAGAKISIAGTVHHRDDILWKIATNVIKGFRVTVLSAYDDKTRQVLWPQRWSYSELQRVRDEEYAKAGRIHLFKREYLSDPAESETHPLQAYSIKRVPKIDRNNGYRVVTIDNAQGTGQDNFAIVETCEDSDGKLQISAVRYSNQWDIGRRVEEVMMFLRRRLPDVIVIQRTAESISLIELVEKAMKEENIRKTITQPTWSKSGTKNEFIYGWLQPALSEGTIVAEEKQEGIERIDDELHSFDIFASKNLDDLIECLANCKKHSKTPKIEKLAKPTGDPLKDRVRRDMMRKNRLPSRKYNRTKIPWV